MTCLYCGLDLGLYEHAPMCPSNTGIYPVRPEDVQLGFACCDCGTCFEVGGLYAQREVVLDPIDDPNAVQMDTKVFEVVCLGCAAQKELAK